MWCGSRDNAYYSMAVFNLFHIRRFSHPLVGFQGQPESRNRRRSFRPLIREPRRTMYLIARAALLSHLQVRTFLMHVACVDTVRDKLFPCARYRTSAWDRMGGSYQIAQNLIYHPSQLAWGTFCDSLKRSMPVSAEWPRTTAFLTCIG